MAKKKAKKKAKKPAKRKAAKKSARKPARKTVKKKAGKRGSRAGQAAFMAPVRPSEALAKLVGYNPLPRTKIVQKLWAYIKKHKLQNKKNLREIITDDILKPIFGNKAKVNMFEMMKWIKKHTKKA